MTRTLTSKEKSAIREVLKKFGYRYGGGSVENGFYSIGVDISPAATYGTNLAKKLKKALGVDTILLNSKIV